MRGVWAPYLMLACYCLQGKQLASGVIGLLTCQSHYNVSGYKQNPMRQTTPPPSVGATHSNGSVWMLRNCKHSETSPQTTHQTPKNSLMSTWTPPSPGTQPQNMALKMKWGSSHSLRAEGMLCTTEALWCILTTPGWQPVQMGSLMGQNYSRSSAPSRVRCLLKNFSPGQTLTSKSWMMESTSFVQMEELDTTFR